MLKFINIINPFKKAQKKAAQPQQCSSCPYQNELLIYFKNDVVMRITRRSGTPLQNELSAYIPRAEIRKRRYENGKVSVEEELIINSITLVDSIIRERQGGTGECRTGVSFPGSGFSLSDKK